MKPIPQESYDTLKMTQVDLPPNLYVYGQPVNLHPAYAYDPANAANPYGFQPILVLNQPVDPLMKEEVELKTSLRRNGSCCYYLLCILAFLAVFGIIRFILKFLNFYMKINEEFIGLLILFQ